MRDNETFLISKDLQKIADEILAAPAKEYPETIRVRLTMDRPIETSHLGKSDGLLVPAGAPIYIEWDRTGVEDVRHRIAENPGQKLFQRCEYHDCILAEIAKLEIFENDKWETLYSSTQKG